MSNMSYCRFQNTLSDLRDCQKALEGLFDGSTDEDGDAALSEEEVRAAKNLVGTCLDIVNLVAENSACEDKELRDIEEDDLKAAIDTAQTAAKEEDDARREEEDRRDAIAEGKLNDKEGGAE